MCARVLGLSAAPSVFSLARAVRAFRPIWVTTQPLHSLCGTHNELMIAFPDAGVSPP